ncbi:PPIL3 [Symbiodinium natans]|uniref:peptidylprolyl isomerase n=1 Tax=Symbiodinium natans TaxID=878477 RepID=A0A812K0U1_9DINO|nr:PPIL3 [Symbiodinium natans]
MATHGAARREGAGVVTSQGELSGDARFLGHSAALHDLQDFVQSRQIPYLGQWYSRIALQHLGIQISMNERVVEWADEGRYLIREVHTHGDHVIAETVLNGGELPRSVPDEQKGGRPSLQRAAWDVEAVMFGSFGGRPSSESSVRQMSLTIKTNLGPLKVELFCAQTPKTCKNFLALAASGYYDNTNFHRNIKGFMIQGGDPTGTGKGGQSIYGGYFEDEFVSTLKHERRGILSMVNTGPNTNGSQFFVTYSRQPHLNGVYTTFGRLIDGLDTLDKMEKEPINAKNRPMRPIKIEDFKQELIRKHGLRTSYNDFFSGPDLIPNMQPMQVFNDATDDFGAPPVGLAEISATGPRKRDFILEEVQPGQAGRRQVDIPIQSPGEAQAFAANYAAASHVPVDVDLAKNEIIPDDPVETSGTFDDNPEEEVQYWVMEGDGSGPVVVRHEHHVSHHHEHGHDGHHHHGDAGRGTYSEHEETVTHTVPHGQGDGGHVTVRHHLISHQVHSEPHRQRYVPPPEPQEDLRLLDEPQVEPLQPKIIAGGLLAIFAQVYLWGNVFVTLFKPNRASPAQPGAAPAPAGHGAPGGPVPAPPAQESAPPAPLVLFGAGGTLGDSVPVTRPAPADSAATTSSTRPSDT